MKVIVIADGKIMLWEADSMDQAMVAVQTNIPCREVRAVELDRMEVLDARKYLSLDKPFVMFPPIDE